MATICPQCDETVRPVVVMDPDCESDSFEDCVDDDAGLHCPRCGHAFADSGDVGLDEYNR